MFNPIAPINESFRIVIHQANRSSFQIYRDRLNPHSSMYIKLWHTSIHSTSLKEAEKEHITIKVIHHDKRVKVPHDEREALKQGPTKFNTRSKVNKSGHKTVYNQGGETTPFPPNQGSNFYLLSQGIYSISISYNNNIFSHHLVRKVKI